MNELIRIETNENQEPIVCGKDLHEFLEVSTRYNDWFPRMVEYGFIEGQDFYSLLSKTSESGRPSTDHHLKLDMAKELCMIQRNEKGKEARQYFIQIEKEYNSPEKIMARALRIADTTINGLKFENTKQMQIIGELKPKADYTDLVLSSKDLLTTTQISKDYGTSAKTMNKKLNELKIQYLQNGQWLLYSDHQAKGFTQSTTIHYTDSNGRAHTKLNTSWTQKGRLFIYEKLKKVGIVPMIERN